jgi:putative hydrolase of the HAD superfamily
VALRGVIDRPPPGEDREPRALLLDALGTLVALKDPAPVLRVELAQRFGIEITEAEARRAIAAEIAYYRAHFDDGSDPAALAALRGRCAEALRSALPAGAAVAEIDTDALTAALLASLRFSAFADARPALVEARSRRRRLVVVSNWDVSLHEVLERLELAPLLDGIVTSAAVGARKPSAAIFERALAVAEVRPRDAAHVGDSVEDDVAGARAAGIEAILLRRDGSAGPAGVRTIASLAAL